MQKLRGFQNGPKESDVIYKPIDYGKLDLVHRILNFINPLLI